MAQAALSPADSACREPWEQDTAWGLTRGMLPGSGPSPCALWLCSGMHLRREPAKSRLSALQ